MTNDSLRQIHVSSYGIISLHLCSTDLGRSRYLLSNFLFCINNPIYFKRYNECWWILKWFASNIHKARSPTTNM
jgi:hypothetical protein